jgi:adapter protein MecA 1/2
LDHVADAAQAVGTLYKGPNALYKDEKTKKFYLVLHSGKGGAEILSRVTNVLSEYGQKIKESELMEAYFKEHYTIMIKRAALKKLATI